MSIIRIKHCNFEETQNAITFSEAHLSEWEGDDVNRTKEQAWVSRYEYEASLISNIINTNKYTDILEIGSGPGVLSQIIQQKSTHGLNYHLVDKPFAQAHFKKENYKGKFFVQDVSTNLDTTNLLLKYDMIICNDTLEHLYAPANIIKQCYFLMKDSSTFFISVPNWRMAHQFIYRGLWDYDNFLYLMYIHQFEPVGVYPSILQTPFYPKLNSEESMPDELIQSWNFYFEFKKKI